MLTVKKGLVIALACAFSFVSIALAQNDDTKNDMSASPEVSDNSGHKVPKGQEPIPVNFDGQPPLVPHSTDFYRVNLNQNDCLKCHDAEAGQQTTAKKMSASHYTADNKPQADRYVCLSCHVEQTDAKPIVNNQY